MGPLYHRGSDIGKGLVILLSHMRNFHSGIVIEWCTVSTCVCVCGFYDDLTLINLRRTIYRVALYISLFTTSPFTYSLVFVCVYPSRLHIMI